uniref:ribonuclease Z n=1 Tax=Macrostomum lignano TaxID=282301 RepID=A0A1I8FAH6_9PLAT
ASAAASTNTESLADFPSSATSCAIFQEYLIRPPIGFNYQSTSVDRNIATAVAIATANSSAKCLAFTEAQCERKIFEDNEIHITRQEFNEKLLEFKADYGVRDDSDATTRCYPWLQFIGTASSNPSKYRNVSAILLHGIFCLLKARHRALPNLANRRRLRFYCRRGFNRCLAAYSSVEHSTKVAAGFAIRGGGKSDHKDWKIVYSGDTPPCANLDGLESEARAKKHSTVGQALSQAAAMRAGLTILTHFSSTRYTCSVPVLKLIERQGNQAAADSPTITCACSLANGDLDRLPRLARMLPYVFPKHFAELGRRSYRIHERLGGGDQLLTDGGDGGEAAGSSGAARAVNRRASKSGTRSSGRLTGWDRETDRRLNRSTRWTVQSSKFRRPRRGRIEVCKRQVLRPVQYQRCALKAAPPPSRRHSKLTTMSATSDLRRSSVAPPSLSKRERSATGPGATATTRTGRSRQDHSTPRCRVRASIAALAAPSVRLTRYGGEVQRRRDVHDDAAVVPHPGVEGRSDGVEGADQVDLDHSSEPVGCQVGGGAHKVSGGACGCAQLHG